jgi:hypothetical protein
MAGRSAAAVREGALSMAPPSAAATWYRWLDNRSVG